MTTDTCLARKSHPSQRGVRFSRYKAARARRRPRPRRAQVLQELVVEATE